MSSPQDTYTETLRSGQDAVVKAFETWTDTAKDAWTNTSGAATPEVDPQQVIDQVFDFAEKMLAVQREFAKSLAVTAASATEAVRKQSESVVEATKQQAASMTDGVAKATKADK